MSDAASKQKARARLRRIAGQVAAIESALDRVGKLLFEHHVEHCVAQAFASGDKRARATKMRELLDVVSRFARVSGA